MLQPLFRYYGPQASGITSFAWAPHAPLLALSTIHDQLQLWDLSSRSLLRSWPAPASSQLTWSPDGSLLLSSSGQLWDPLSGQLLLRLPDYPSSSSLSPNGSLIASYSRTSRALLLWESHQGLFLHRLPHPRPISAFSWSPDGFLLASTTEGLLSGLRSIESQLQLWDPSSGSLLRSWPASSLPPLSWSPDGSLLLTTVGDLWDARTGQLLLRLPEHAPSPISALAWSPDGSLIALGHKDGSLSLWHLPSNQLLFRLSAPSSSPISALVWSPDGSLLASASEDRTIAIWHTSSRHLLHRLSLPSPSSIFSLSWSYDSAFLASASSPHPQAYSSSALFPPLQEYSVTIWHPSSKQPLLSFPASAHHFTTALWLPNTHFLAIGDQAGFLHLWRPSSDQPSLLLHAHSQPITALSCSPDGSLLASASEDRTIAIWHTPSGRLLHRYTSHSYIVVALAWSPDGSRIASADDEGLIHLWNPLTGKTLLTKPFEHECWSPSLSWSPDGSRLAVTACSDQSPPRVSIWQADTFQPLLHYYGHHHDIQAVSWSPDGSLIASLSSDPPDYPFASSLHLWAPSSGRLLHRWRCHALLPPVWSPDGSLLAFDGPQALEIRSVRPGLPLLFLPASSPCAWSPDGSLLASLSPFSVDLWPVSSLLS